MRTSSPEAIVVMVSCPGDRAEAIASALVDESLCACVNIVGNMRSVYRWEGKVLAEEESLLVMKTMGKMYDKLEARIKEIHPYELPEIIALKIENGSQSYLNWINDSISKA
ncbi:MAG: divalent cation tolerance protein CutA [Cyanobacteria bacterium REEB67]|nr:divalent cation tolerance protein CutA [Cyanobacteria bacterium REEB67]